MLQLSVHRAVCKQKKNSMKANGVLFVMQCVSKEHKHSELEQLLFASIAMANYGTYNCQENP